jgi:phosphoglycerate dehydrogenase-like enzyme
VVIGANLGADIAARIRAARPELDVRAVPVADITAADLEWADAYAGFKRPPAAPTMGNVRWVHCTGAGVDAWLAPPGLAPDVLLTRTSESFGPAIAEWAVARVLAFQMQLPDLARAQAERRWAPRDIAPLAGTRALIVGAGDVGTHVARALAALGVRVTGVSRSGRHPGDGGATSSPAPRATASRPSPVVPFVAVHPVAELPALVGCADWIVLALPITPATRGLFSRDLLAKCRGAVLLNAGRGATLEESALPEALAKGWLRGAALDVFEVEPLPAESPLWADPRVIISPHISGLTTAEGAARGFLECLADLEAGRLPKWTVDRVRGY